MYLTYSRYPIELHYAKKIICSNEQLYLVGQIDEEQPYFSVKGNFFHIGMELFPTTPWYFFHVAGKNLTDTGIILSQIEPYPSQKILKTIDPQNSSEEIAEALQRMLIELLPGMQPRIAYIVEALSFIYKNNGNIEIGELIKMLNLSETHFRRQFIKVVGIGAKKYCKIIQFNIVFEAIRSGNETQLYDLALVNGYYDHAHFINDFKSYLGQSPHNFLKSEHHFLKHYLGTFKSL